MLSIGSHSLHCVIANLNPGAGNFTRRTNFSVAPTSRVVTVLYLTGSRSSLHHHVRGVLLNFACRNGPFAIGSLNMTNTVAMLLGSTVSPGLMRAARGAPTLMRNNPFTGVTRKYGSILTAGLTVACTSCIVARTNFNTSLKTRGFCSVGYHGTNLAPGLAILMTATHTLGVRNKIPRSRISRPGLRTLGTNVIGLSGRLHGLRSFKRAMIITFGHCGNSASRRVGCIHRRYTRLNINFRIGGTCILNNRNTTSLTHLITRAVRRGPSSTLRFTCRSASDMRRGVNGMTHGLCKTTAVALDTTTGGGLTVVTRLNCARFPVYVTGARCSFSASTGGCNTPRNFNFAMRSVIVGTNTRVLMMVTNSVVHVPNLPGRPTTLRVSVIGKRVRNLT